MAAVLFFCGFFPPFRCIFLIHNPLKKTSRAETLHTVSDACTYSLRKFAVQDKMKVSSSKDDLVVT